MIKSLIGPKGWEETVRRYVPAPVFAQLAAHGQDGLKRDLGIMH
jgi:hypothetical protein